MEVLLRGGQMAPKRIRCMPTAAFFRYRCSMFSSSGQVLALVRYCVIHAEDGHKLPEYESYIPGANHGHTV
jgi:hypothetical protein